MMSKAMRWFRWPLWAAQAGLLYWLSQWVGSGGELRLAIEPATIAAIASIVASGASAANSLGLFGGQGGGEDPRFSFTNPFTGQLVELSGARLDPVFGFVPGFPGQQPGGGLGIFGGTEPDPNQSPLFNALRALAFDVPGINEAESQAQTLISRLTGDLTARPDLFGNLLDFSRELTETGFRTDISPIVERELNRLETVTRPLLFENTPISSSAIIERGGRALSDLGFELGGLQTGLDEAAAQRRLGGPAATAAALGIPVNLSSDLLGLGSAFRRLQELPNLRPLELFQTLAGLGTQAGPGTITGGFPTTDPTAAALNALAEAGPGLVEAFGGLSGGLPSGFQTGLERVGFDQSGLLPGQSFANQGGFLSPVLDPVSDFFGSIFGR